MMSIKNDQFRTIKKKKKKKTLWNENLELEFGICIFLS